MKKFIISSLIFISSFFWITFWEGCFHDEITTTNKAWIITQWARVRNLACMEGSDIIITLRVGTKVRIIGQTARTKIILPDWKIWRVGNNFIKETDNWDNIPNEVTDNSANTYCDTTNAERCPNACAPGETPTFYYKENNTQIWNNIVLDNLLEQFYEKLDQKYGENQIEKNNAIKLVIKALNILKKQNKKIESAIIYLVKKLQENL